MWPWKRSCMSAWHLELTCWFFQRSCQNQPWTTKIPAHRKKNTQRPQLKDSPSKKHSKPHLPARVHQIGSGFGKMHGKTCFKTTTHFSRGERLLVKFSKLNLETILNTSYAQSSHPGFQWQMKIGRSIYGIPWQIYVIILVVTIASWVGGYTSEI